MSPASQSLTHRILFGLWLNWVLAFMSVAVVLVLPFFISRTWLPVPVLFIAYLLLVYVRRDTRADIPGCVLSLRVVMHTLAISALIMFVINLLNTWEVLEGLVDLSAGNAEIPYIVCLIVFPVMAVCCLWQTLRRTDSKYCRRCSARNGFFSGNGVLSSIYSRESRYQIAILLYISLTLAVIEWWYYACYYININLNTPDRFFFNYMPLTVIVLSGFFMRMRYSNLADIIGPMAAKEQSDNTLVRFLVLSGDCMLLAEDAAGRFDTPAAVELAPEHIVSEADARREFERLLGRDDFSLRFLYTSKAYDMQSQVLHYAVFLPESSDGEPAPTGWLNGTWLSLDRIDRLMKSAGLAAELADEIYRIFTITMAWKTYDRYGRRLYPIRHYRPTFRLRDLKDWDVDYGDLHWLTVADNNQDHTFYNTRRIWRRMTGESKQ